jgi:O-methyltransferase domain
MLAVRKERSKPALFDRPRPHHRRGDPVTASGAGTSGDRELRPPRRFPSPAPTPSQWQTRSAPTSIRPTPPADVYLLSKVLNNWPDRETTAILTRCAEAGRPSGVVPAVGGAAPNAPQACTIEMVRLGGTTDPLRSSGGAAPSSAST